MYVGYGDVAGVRRWGDWSPQTAQLIVVVVAGP